MRRRQTVRGWFGYFHAHVGYDGQQPRGTTPLTPLVWGVGLFAAYAYRGWWWLFWLSMISLLIAVVGSFRVAASRLRDCEEHGHQPYRPVPHLREYRCWHCRSELPDDYPVSRVARTAKRRSQAYYSDRS